MQKAKRPEIWTQLEAEFKRERNRYKELIKTGGKRSWGKLVTDIGNKDPWGIVYKIMAGKRKRADICGLKDGGRIYR